MSFRRFHYITYLLLSYNVPALGMEKNISLHDLARQNNTAELQKALDRGLFIDETNNKGLTALHIAAKVGHLKMVLFLLNKGADVDKKSTTGSDAVTLARDNGHNDIAQVLEAWERKTEKGISEAPPQVQKAPSEINKLDEQGKSLLHKASEQGNVAEALGLIKMGADVRVVNKKGGTVLHTAAYCGHLKLCQLFVEQGCNVNAKNSFGNTPLHVAAIQGHAEIVSFLLTTDIDTNCKNSNDHTALDAAKFSHKEAVVALLSQKSPTKTQKVEKKKADKSNTGFQKPLERKQERVAQATTRPLENTHATPAANVVGKKRTYIEEGNTELHDAAHEGNLTLVNQLLARGVNVNILNARKMSPLFFAALGQHLSVLVTLLEKGASYDLQDESCLNPSHYATLRAPDAEGQVISFLIQKGYLKMKPNETKAQLYNRLRWPILEKAFPGHQFGEVKVDIHNCDSEGKYLIHNAAIAGDAQEVERFLNCGGDVNIGIVPIYDGQEEGYSALHCAAYKGHLNVVKLLIARKADLNRKTASGRTPLHEAAEWGQTLIVRELIAAGAQTNVKNSKGETALQTAQRKPFPDKNYAVIINSLTKAT